MRTSIRLPLLVLGLTLLGVSTERADAQDESVIQARPRQTVKVEWAVRRFDGQIPFAEPFNIRGSLPEGVDSAHLKYGRTVLDDAGRRQTVFGSTASFKRSPVLQQEEFWFPVGPLDPNRAYLFRFLFFKSGEDPKDSTKMIVTRDSISIPVTARTSLGNHFDSDVGVMYGFNTDYWGLATNAHFYLLPINKNEDLSRAGAVEQVLKRVSIFAGLAVQRVDSDEEVKELFEVGTPVFGVGLRGLPGLDFLRVNAGVMIFKQDDANPLVTRERTKRDAFVGLTADIEIKKLLGPLIALIQ